jgi:hypothetical protein
VAADHCLERSAATIVSGSRAAGVRFAVGFLQWSAFNRKAATVPGQRMTDLQVNKYKAWRGEHSQETAAAKTGISMASARRVESAVVLPSPHPQQHRRQP